MLTKMLHVRPWVSEILVADSILGCIPDFLVPFLLGLVTQLVFVLDPSVSVIKC